MGDADVIKFRKGQVQPSPGRAAAPAQACASDLASGLTLCELPASPALAYFCLLAHTLDRPDRPSLSLGLADAAPLFVGLES